MSVQAGIWNFNGQPVDRVFLARISERVAEYGPDGEAYFLDGPVGMLYRPFHTTSESRLERQPYISPSGQVIIWDGRLDNREELYSLLSRVIKYDQTDVAIVAAAFEQWGTGCFAKLMGDWGLSIWDPRAQELILARDYIGIRHLYYYWKPKRIIWCNNLAPLALSGDQFTVCDEYIAGYFGFWPDSHLTPYRELCSVPSGKFVRVHGGRLSIHAYWTFNPYLKTRYKSDSEYEEHFRSLFRQSVRRRLRADSPILADLSGGFDSSSIVCMADDILATEGGDILSLDTFTFSDREEPDEDDFLYFAKVEDKRGRVGHHAELKSLGNTYSFDYSTFVATPGFAEREELNAAKSDVIKRGSYRVVLSGEGGDHMLGQDRNPRTQIADLLLRFNLVQVNRLLSAWSLHARRPWIQLLCQSLLMLMPASIRAGIGRVNNREPWLNTRFARRHGVAERLLPAAEGSWSWPPSVRHSFQSLRQLAGMMTTVRPSIVERRYPFLDRTLTEFLTSIPSDQLLRPGERRSLMRRALINILPREILLRQTKSSSVRCDVLTLERHWNRLETILHSPISDHLGYVDADRLRTALIDMKNGRVPPYVVQLLRALSLEVWLREAVERDVISLPMAAGQNIRLGSTCSTSSHAPS